MLVRGMRVAACLAVCVTVAATFSGCDRLVFGAKAREARVLDAVRHGDSDYLGTGSPLRVGRRWIAPPLLGTEFFEVVLEDDRRRSDFQRRQIVALDNRALPLLLSGNLHNETSLAFTRGVYDRAVNVPRVNELLSRESVEITTPAEARQAAMVVARLTPWGPALKYFGEIAFDADHSAWEDSIASRAGLDAPPRPTVSERSAGTFDATVVGLYHAFGQSEIIEWRVVIADSRVASAVGTRRGQQF